MIVDNELHVLYGQLQYVLKFKLPEFAANSAKIYLIAFIRPCKRDGVDATTTRAYFDDMGRIGVADLTCFVATVGRVPMGEGRYGVVDRSTEEAWPSVYEDFPQQVPMGSGADE
jgi:hypothetical protein